MNGRTQTRIAQPKPCSGVGSGRVLVFALAVTLACGRTSTSPDGGDGEAGDTTSVAGSAAMGGNGGTGNTAGEGGRAAGSDSGGSGVAGSAGSGGVTEACDVSIPPAAPLRRLTHFEYENTIRDLFGELTDAEVLLPVERSKFPEVPYLSAAVVEAYHTISHDLASRLTADVEALALLTDCVSALGATCQAAFIEALTTRVFRRPSTPNILAEFAAVFAKGQELGGDFASGARAVIEVALQSPEFLYRLEFGEPLSQDSVDNTRPSTWARPSPHEMANRLSYLLRGSMPDAELLEAAQQGGLRTREEILDQARRLLADERAEAVVRHFYFGLLHLRDPVFPAIGEDGSPLSPALAQLLIQETGHFIDEVTWQGSGDFASLLTAPFTWVNGPLAQFYGIEGVTGEAFQRVSVEPLQRGGLLTQGSFLASRPTSFQRGLVVSEQFLCRVLPPPPPDVPVLPVPPDQTSSTTRQRLEEATADPSCAGCHAAVNSLGFAFEHYDRAGLWRDTENAQPIDAKGELETNGMRRSFDGALELAQHLAESDEAKACYVGKWMSVAYGTSKTSEHDCSRRQLERVFIEGNVIELLLELTQTDAFLYRPSGTGQP